MAKKTSTTGTHPTKDRAKEVVSGGTAVRSRVRQLSVDAFRERGFSLGDVRKLVHEVLEGAVEGVDKSIPASGGSVLREVFDGLSEGVHAIASAGSAAVSEARERGRKIVGKDMPAATKRISAANDDFLGAVRSFADTASTQMREELDSLVARAERTGPKVAGSARKAAKAADGRLVELTDETARAGVRVARRAAGALAMGASGLLEGVAEIITPRGRPTTSKKGAKTTARDTRKKPVRKATKKKGAKKRRKS
jgi:hypothetical protein